MIGRARLLLAFVLCAGPAWAHHRQTPPIVPVTTDGDASLPRVPAFRGRLALALDAPGGRLIYRRPRRGTALAALTDHGNSDNPAISSTGNVVAWDSDGDLLGSGDPGRQVYVLTGDRLAQLAHDPTGTSTNPAVDARGAHVAFQSSGDLAGTGNAGALQIFLRGLSGPLVQVTAGTGQSRNPAFDRFGRTLAFESTGDPVTGADTGVAQVWVFDLVRGAQRLTAGLAASRRPAIAPRGRFVAFESTADLAGSGADTGVSQVFAYDRLSGNFAQVTNEPGGCSGATVDETPGDWRVVFACSGQGYLHLLRANERHRLPVDGGDTPRAVAELGNFFVVVTTTANMLGTGTTSGHQVYQLNLFKLPAALVAGTEGWFPDVAFRP